MWLSDEESATLFELSLVTFMREFWASSMCLRCFWTIILRLEPVSIERDSLFLCPVAGVFGAKVNQGFLDSVVGVGIVVSISRLLSMSFDR